MKRGQRVFAIDPRELLARQSSTAAPLAQARADLARSGPLLRENAIAHQVYDNAVAAEHAAQARVDAGQATRLSYRSGGQRNRPRQEIAEICATKLPLAASMPQQAAAAVRNGAAKPARDRTARRRAVAVAPDGRTACTLALCQTAIPFPSKEKA